MSSDRLAEIAGRLSLREDGAGRSSSSPVRSQPSPDEHAGAAGAGPGGVGGGRGGGGGGEAASSNSGRESRTPSDVTGITPEKLGPNDFLFGEELGQGSYSSVKRATMKRSGKAAAIKVVEKALVIKEKKTQYMVMERDCLTLCIHPGVIRLNATFQDANCLYFVMDACPHDLFYHLNQTRSFSVACARFYAAELVDILEYIHSKNIIHRDLKPENMLVSEAGHIKLTDFGTARIIKSGEEGNRTKSFVGTAEYCSPELLENLGTCQSSDLWALGCTLFQFLAGKVPFRGGSEYLTFQQILALDYAFPDDFPEVAKALVKSLLVLEPTSRLGSDERGMGRRYADVRGHAFFADVQWSNPPLFEQKPPPFEPFVAA